MTVHDDGPLFHVTSFELLDKDDGRVLFLVHNLDDGTVREITVKRDEQGFYEFTVNGDGYYDVENEPDYLTLPLMDKADEMVREYLDQQHLIHANVVVHRLYALSDPGRVH